MNDHRQWYLKIKYLPSFALCLNQRRASFFASSTNKHQTKTSRERQQQKETNPPAPRAPEWLVSRIVLPCQSNDGIAATHGESKQGPLAQKTASGALQLCPSSLAFLPPGHRRMFISRGARGCHSLSGPIAASRLGSDGARGGTSECGYCGAIGRRCLSSLVRCFWY